MFTSSKRFGPITTGHRQWRHQGHCSFIHGYGRIVEITFEANNLDERGWVMDFGNLKQVKEWIESEWDHRVLIAHDDPALNYLKEMHDKELININILPEGYGPGIEQSCEYIYDGANRIVKKITNGLVWVKKVKIFEHENNWAEYNA